MPHSPEFGNVSAATVATSGTITATGNIVGDTIAERTGGAGVTIDGVLLKDSQIPAKFRTMQATYRKDANDGAAGTTTAELWFGRVPATATEVSCNIVPDGVLTAHDTNYATIIVYKRDGAGGGSTFIAAVNTKTGGSGGSGDWAAGVTVPLALNSPALAAGTVLSFEITKNASGVVVPAFELCVDWTVD